MLKKVRFIIVLISLSLSLSFMSSTYSRYVAETPGNIDMLFANWQILVNNTDITTTTSSEITFTPVIEENENVASNVIAPSSKGYFDIDINPSNVDVSFSYLIELDIQNENVPDITLTGYSIYDDTYVEGVDTLDVLTLVDDAISGNKNFDNNTADFQFDNFSIRVYFEWAEGDGESMDDEADTNIGLLAVTEGTTFTLSADITFEQIL